MGKTIATVAVLDITEIMIKVPTKSSGIAAMDPLPLTRNTPDATQFAAPKTMRAKPITSDAINKIAKSKSKFFLKSSNWSTLTAMNINRASDVAMNKSIILVIPKNNKAM